MSPDGITKQKIKWVILCIPLILSSFTHIWNAAEFPSFHPDEGVYLRRALHFLDGLGLQDQSSRYDHSQDSTSAYDHPYFGPIFLAFAFKIVNYPQFLNAAFDSSSIETAFATPRLIMGILAVLDTFLVYKICERKFNPTVALIASLLFAVMPINWYTRRIVLDSIMLPFALLSILFALELYSRSKCIQLIVILSGVSLGLAIFTKIACFSLIPLVGFLIYQNLITRIDLAKTIKILGSWIIAVILVPSIWPIYALLSGDLNEWIDGVYWQALERYATGKLLTDIVGDWFSSDPLLLVLGSIGIVYLTIKREYMAILWIVPYFALLYIVGWVTHFHLILVIPILCISSAKLLYDLSGIFQFANKIRIVSSISNRITWLDKMTGNRTGLTIITSGIVLFGLISTALLIANNLSYVQIASVSYIGNEITRNRVSYLGTNNSPSSNYANNSDSSEVTIISSPAFSWVWKYVFNHNYSFSHVRESQAIKTQKIILIVDSTYKHVISNVEGENRTQLETLMDIYDNTNIIAFFKELPTDYKKKDYPFTGIDSASIGSRLVEIRANY